MFVHRRHEAADPGQARATLAPVFLVAAIVLLISLAAAVAVVHPWPDRPLSMLDLRVYLWGGAAARHGQDPYLNSYDHVNLPFTYPPLAAICFALIANIGLSPMMWLSLAANVVVLVAVVWRTWGALGYGRTPKLLAATLALSAVAIWAEPVLRTLSFGQVNLVLMLIVLADLLQPDGRWWKGAGVGLAAGFKLTPLIFVAYLLLTRRFRAAAVSVVTFCLTITASVAVIPKAAVHYWLGALFLNPHRLGNVAYLGNQSLSGVLVRLTGSSAAARPYWLAAAMVTGTAGLLLAAWATRQGRELAGILLCALTGLLISPVSWSHHWVWLVPLLVMLADFAVRRAREPVAWLPVVAVAAVFSGLLWAMPASAQQGHVMNVFEQLLGALYVVAGLAGLAIAALLLARDACGTDRSAPKPPRVSPALTAGAGQLARHDASELPSAPSM